MKHKLEQVGTTTSFTSSVLQNVTVDRKGRFGAPAKKIKCINVYLERFKCDFKRTMSRCMQGDSSPPEQVGTIRQKLEDNHLVITVGYGESDYLLTVFHAIKEPQYETNYCALLTEPSDWIHVDPDDVKLVVFKDPFGSVVFDKNKATAMFNKLEDIQNSREYCQLDVIIASKGEILNEAMRVLEQTPDVFDDTIVVYKGTSAPTPSDSLIQQMKLAVEKNYPPLYSRNVSQISKCYAEDLQKRTLKTNDDTNYRMIFSKLNDTHCVVLTAADSESLSKCITYLTAAFPSFLTVFHRDDIMNANLGNAGVIVVVDMAGKYVFDKLKANQWLETFDSMKPMVNNGKPNIAVVMEKKRLHECLRETEMHWIFQNVLEMTSSEGIVDVDVQNIIKNELGRPSSVSIQTDPTLRHVADMELLQRDEGENAEGSCITGMTVVEGRLLVAVDRNKYYLCSFELNTSTQLPKYDMPSDMYGVTALPDGRVAVTFPKDGEIHFLESQSGGFLFINRITVDKGCHGIVYSDDKLIVSYRGYTSKNVQILNMEGNVQQVFEKDIQGKNLFDWPEQVAVSPDHNTMYVSDMGKDTVTALTRNGHVLGVVRDKDNLRGPRGLTVDATGCVYVCGYHSFTVCLVSPETSSVTRLLGKEDGLEYPCSVAVCDKSRRLYVGMEFSSKIKVFTME